MWHGNPNLNISNRCGERNHEIHLCIRGQHLGVGKSATTNVFLQLVFHEVLQCKAAIIFISCLMTWFSKFCFQSLCFTLLCLYVLLVFVLQIRLVLHQSLKYYQVCCSVTPFHISIILIRYRDKTFIKENIVVVLVVLWRIQLHILSKRPSQILQFQSCIFSLNNFLLSTMYKTIALHWCAALAKDEEQNIASL